MTEGSFLSDGSWTDSPHHQGNVHKLVKGLVADRRQDSLSPERAAREVTSTGTERAFPNVLQWASASRWPLCQASTSAEEAVKRGGAGPSNERHWCNGCWIHGLEKDCRDQSHKIKPTTEETARLVATLSRGFE